MKGKRAAFGRPVFVGPKGDRVHFELYKINYRTLVDTYRYSSTQNSTKHVLQRL